MRCLECGSDATPVAKVIAYCACCIRNKPEKVLPVIAKNRNTLGKVLPVQPIDAGRSVAIKRDNKSHRNKSDDGLVAMGFYDPMPANCTASWMCPGTTDCGYPNYTENCGVEHGCKNLAVFTGGCNFDCPFCQCTIHEQMEHTGRPRFSDEEIVSWVEKDTTCISFCGGTPDIQLPSINRIVRKMREQYPGRILRICAETNLTAPWKVLEEFARHAFETGGGLNIGLKGGSMAVHKALTSAPNDKVWRNMRKLYETFGGATTVPLLRPCVLVVPGYIDEYEIRVIAERIVAIDECISLKLLPFYPRDRMIDLPQTQVQDLKQLAKVAEHVGLRFVNPPSNKTVISERFIR